MISRNIFAARLTAAVLGLLWVLTAASPLRAETAGTALELEIALSNGENFSFAGHRGQTVLLSFFASWCHNCKEEAPIVNGLYKELGAKVSVIGIDTEASSVADAAATAKSFGYAYPVSIDPGETLKQRFGIGKKLPATVLIDESGNAVRTVYGMTPAVLSEIREKIAESRQRMRDLARRIGSMPLAAVRPGTVEASSKSPRAAEVAGMIQAELAGKCEGREKAPFTASGTVSTLGSSASASVRLADSSGRVWFEDALPVKTDASVVTGQLKTRLEQIRRAGTDAK